MLADMEKNQARRRLFAITYSSSLCRYHRKWKNARPLERENPGRREKRKICEECIGKVWWILLEKFEEVHKKVAFPLSFFAILH